MPSKSTSSNEVRQLRRILEVASRNAAFRTELLQDPARAVVTFKKDLGFSKLARSVLEVLKSLTENELDSLISVKGKIDVIFHKLEFPH